MSYLGLGAYGNAIVDLAHEANRLQEALKANRRDALNDDNAADVQALCVAEEAGELVAAYREYTGRARKQATLEDVEHEVADVLIVTAIFANLLNIDINKALADKLAIIYTRGWKAEEAA